MLNNPNRSIELDPRKDNFLKSHIIGFPRVNYLWECEECSLPGATESSTLKLPKEWAKEDDNHKITCTNTVHQGNYITTLTISKSLSKTNL